MPTGHTYFFFRAETWNTHIFLALATHWAKTLIRLGECPYWYWSDWANAQADLSPRWAHTHFVGFVMRRLICHLSRSVAFDLHLHYLQLPLVACPLISASAASCSERNSKNIRLWYKRLETRLVRTYEPFHGKRDSSVMLQTRMRNHLMRQ